tara:strand:+ start:70 stop:399 length:330 start_codon:yes stop_codon:yes gene_type:complete
MNRLDGKTALISGASRGIGEAAARLMISVGANVIIGDILKTKGEETAERLGPKAKFIHLDVTDENDWSNAVDLAKQLIMDHAHSWMVSIPIKRSALSIAVGDMPIIINQ